MENILTAIARIYQKNMENNENLLPFEVKDYESVKNRNSRTNATPHELSRLTYPWMEIACNAIFISSGEVSVLIQENESGEPELVLDAAPYEKTKRIYEGLQRMGEQLADQMEEADAEEREREEDWER